ncbi:hypothetical protein QM012_002435 [Aureobasidium pullulans]|uniref:Uncharacterized protein n=1 Tax=Aureobasidium pullulans TaxID=5580 RepID=A0ABR0TDA3_AURPU
MKAFSALVFALTTLLSTGYAHNITHSTTTATVTKTVFQTVTASVNVATLPGFAPHGPAFGSSASAEYDPSFELKSMAVQTIEFTSTIFSTEVDGVVITSLSTIVAPVTSTTTELQGITSTSTDFQEVTSTTTKHAGTTITTTSVVVSASTTSAAASSISIEQNIAQMWGLNGSEHVQVSRWLVFSVVILGVAHYLFFAHH